MGNYATDILNEKDPVKRMENLHKRLAERLPADLIVFTALSVLSDDDEVRRTVLEHVDARERNEGNTASRIALLIQSWRSEGALMTWPEPMNAIQNKRAAEIEAACRAKLPLSSVVKKKQEQQSSQPTSSVSDEPKPEVSGQAKPWWKFW